MSTIPERLEKLRAKMQEKGIDIYIIPTADFHQSEYVGEHFKAREYITGFTGSAGTAVVSKTEARLWTDGRYFIQAAKQLEGRYPYLKKKPYLLPIAWLQRIGQYGSETRKQNDGSNRAADAVKIGAKRVELLRTYGILRK